MTALGTRRALRTTGALVVAAHAAPTAVVTALGGVLAWGVGAAPGTAWRVALAVLLGQLSVGWSNDWLDAARDRRSGRTDKPVVRGHLAPTTLRAAAVLAAAACLLASWSLGVVAGSLHVLAVASAWSYNAVLKRTAASWVPYAVSFGLLPAFVVATLPGTPLPEPWVVLTGALLGVGAHLLNALPDLEDDLRTGVRGLPHRWGRTRTAVAAPAVLGTGVLVAALGAHMSPGAARVPPTVLAGVALAALVAAVLAGRLAVRRPRSRTPFALAMLVAVACVLVLVGAGPAAVRAPGAT